MEPALTSLFAASVTFVGSHFAMSHPLRGPMVRIFGEKGFLGVYSLVSLAAFAWIVIAFRAAPPGNGGIGGSMGDALWALASLLTLVAMVLLIGSFCANPALPDTPAEKVAKAEAQGVFRVTRHPMLWGFAFWAFAHLCLSWSQRTTIVANAILILALVGAHLQDRKKKALLGEAWKHWEAQTSYWPRLGQLFKLNPVLWLVALALWLAASWAHIPAAYIPAGIWRWLV